MSEEKYRFRVKRGDIEIEYEGKSPEVNARFKEAFDWVKTVTVSPPKPEPKKEKELEEKKEKKRGGARTAVISPAIDELIEEGFLDDFKRADHVLDELTRKTVPVSGIEPVILALNRRVPKVLDRVKDKEGKWVYRKKT